jgi:hypothetical protein
MEVLVVMLLLMEVRWGGGRFQDAGDISGTRCESRSNDAVTESKVNSRTSHDGGSG